MSDDLDLIAQNKETPVNRVKTPKNAKKPLGDTPIYEQMDEYNYIPPFSYSDQTIFKQLSD